MASAVYVISIELLDISQAITLRQRNGALTRPYQAQDPQHLDTPTGLPADLDLETRQSSTPVTPIQELLAGWCSFQPHKPVSDQLNPEAASFEPLSQQRPRSKSKSKFSTTIKPVFTPYRRLDWRFGRILVDMQDYGDLPQAGRSSTTESINVGFGLIRLRRQPSSSPSSQEQEQQDTSTSSEPVTSDAPADLGDGCTLAVLALPPIMTVSDFLQFVAPGEEMIRHIAILRDQGASRSMALIRFRSAQEAELFRDEFNAKPFWAMSPEEVCHAVQVKEVEVKTTSTPPFTFPTAMDEPSGSSQTSASPMLELPSCVVCLERLDANITGLITIPCQHTFHCSCLSKWASGRCPVCRYTQNLAKAKNTRPSHVDERGLERTSCDQCQGLEQLWMCLLCGHVGGGRYACRHAVSHFEHSGHIFAMELETQRVWDYAGDAYVHRLIQNQSDGKLVELPSLGPSRGEADANGSGGEGSKGGLGPDSAASQAQGKTEKMAEEFSGILISQLESQRNYFLEKMSELKQDLLLMSEQEEQWRLESEVHESRLAKARAETDSERQAKATLETRIQSFEHETVPNLQRDRERIEKRLDRSHETVRLLQHDLDAEKSMTKGLSENLRDARAESKQMRSEITDLQETVRDLVANLTFRDRIEASNNPELVNSSVTGTPTPPQATTPSKPSSKKKKKPKKPPGAGGVVETEEAPSQDHES